jgi:hypothetical protein
MDTPIDSEELLITYNRFAFLTLVAVVAMSGASQGLTLPLLSVLLEQAGISSASSWA